MPPPRDEQLLMIELTASVIRAGVGVHDLIRPPAVEMKTSVMRRTDAAQPYSHSDYLVDPQEIERTTAEGQTFDRVEPFSSLDGAFTVDDWAATEALLKHVFHTALALPRPPLAHPVLLCLPPHLPPLLVDQFHQLLFERLLVPQLLVGSRPFFAVAAVGALNAVILDVGARGEASDVSVVVENQVVEHATMSIPVDEGHLDDYLMLRLLQAQPDLEKLLSSDGQPLNPDDLVSALQQLVDSIKATKDAIMFKSPLFDDSIQEAAAAHADDGEFDVAKALVEGNIQSLTTKVKAANGSDADFITVPHPLDSTRDAIRIGPERHRYFEPLLVPHVLQELKPSASSTATQLNLTEYEDMPVIHSGAPEAIGCVVEQLESAEQRASVWENVVVVSTGKPAASTVLGNALLPLLSPFVIDQESGSETQAKLLRLAKVPDYFSEFKDRQGETACYLGSCIFAKLLISDLQSRLFMSKVDYSSVGPAYYRMLEAL